MIISSKTSTVMEQMTQFEIISYSALKILQRLRLWRKNRQEQFFLYIFGKTHSFFFKRFSANDELDKKNCYRIGIRDIRDNFCKARISRKRLKKH